MSGSIPLEKIDWLRDRHLDPNGRVFSFEGEIYRAIYPEKVVHIRSLFERGIVGDLVDRGLLIGSEISGMQVDGYGLVLKHQRLAYRTKPYEWPRGLLRDAGLCVLDLNLALLEHGLMTVDTHAGNLGQGKGCRPVWTDFGSIVPLTGHYPLEQYRRYFTNPLRMLNRAPMGSQLIRSALRDGGVDSTTLNALEHPRWSPLRMVQPLSDRAQQRFQAATGTNGSGRGVRERQLHQERDRLESLHFELPETQWGSYHHSELDVFPPDYTSSLRDARRTAIFGIIDQLQPRSVIDMAANAGFYSFYAARKGAEVLGVDFDEPAIERLYLAARKHAPDLSVTCACGDAMEAPPVPRSAELVLALALTHHLLLGQGYTLEAVAAMLARITTKTLVVEFMPNGLGGTVPYPDPLPSWYTLERFCDSLRPHFGNVEVVDYPYDPARNRRILVRANDRVAS